MLELNDKHKKWLTPPIKISYHAWKNFKQCPHKFELVNIFYWTPKTADSRRFFLGAVHAACLERWIKDGKLVMGYMASIFDAEFNKYLDKYTVVFLDKDDKEKLRAKGKHDSQLLEYGLFISKLNQSDLGSEVKLEVELPKAKGVLLTGRVDLLLPSTHMIIDAKMTKDTTFFDWTQVKHYCMMGALKGLKTNRGALLVPLHKDIIRYKDFTAGDLLDAYKEFMGDLRKIRQCFVDGFTANFNKNACYLCEVSRFCKTYKTQMSPVDRPVTVIGNVKSIAL